MVIDLFRKTRANLMCERLRHKINELSGIPLPWAVVCYYRLHQALR